MINREIIKDILSNLVLFLLFLSLLVSAHLVYANELPWLYLFMAIPFLGLLLVRKKVYVLVTFFIIHGLFLALPFIFFSSLAEIIPAMLIAFLSAVYSIRVRAKTEWRPDNRDAVIIPASIGAMFFVINVIFGAGVEDVDRFFFAVIFIIIAASLMVIHMDNVDNRLDVLPASLKNSTPIRNILTANNTLISGFLAFMMAIGMLSLFAPNIWRITRLGAFGLIHGLRALFMLLAAPFLLIRDVEHVEPVPDSDEWMLQFQYNLVNEEFLDAEAMVDAELEHFTILFYILSFILISLLVIVIVFALRSAIRALIRNFFNNKDGDESESLMPDDAKGKLKFLLNDITAFLPRFRSDVKHPIRKAFSKKVNWHIKKGVQIRVCDTPDVIADKIRATENIDELTLMYEKVRYGRLL